MTSSPLQRFCGGVAIALALVCLASCAVPLAPGYQIDRQSISVHFVSGEPPHLAIHAEYRLVNTGNAPLDFLEVGMPGEERFGRANLRVVIDGREITPQQEHGEEVESDAGESAVSEKWPAAWRIAFGSKWQRKQRRNLVIDYDLAATATTDPRMVIDAKAFYLNDSGWFPNPLQPKSLFAKDVTRPNPSNLIVDVPDGFAVTASGQSLGAHKTGNETEYRFRLGKDDFDPFVAAGAYQQQQIQTAGGTMFFWTLQPFSPANASAIAKSLAAAGNSFASAFGALTKTSRSLIVLQIPPFGQNSPANLSDYARITLPGIVFFAPQSFSSESAAETVAPILERRLALSWFERVITPRPEAWLLGNSLAAYAVEAANEKSGAGPARGEFIRLWLGAFDRSREQAAEKPIAFLTPADPAQQLQIGDAKALLFLFALEDRCGRENVEHALAHMVYALRGGEYGYADLRAALEQECHQDLSDSFAMWLDQKGIPADFRAKYQAASQPQH